jgi:exodeoxyribonuclease VII small subunit
MPENVAKLDETVTFEEALKELEALVARMETGKIPLEEAVSLYERGMALKQFCAQKLESARLRVEKVTVQEDGKLQLTPFTEEP